MTREEAIEELLCMKHLVRAGSDADKALDMAIEVLQEPERKTGRWVEIDFHDGTMYGFHYCSECGIRTHCTFDTPPDWKYCPNCGAKMEEEK